MLERLVSHLAAGRHDEAIRIAGSFLFPSASAQSGGRTALHYAAYYGNPEVCGLLLRRGAPVNAQDARGATPLFDAVHSGCCEVVRELLQHGARADHADRVGCTPLFQLDESPSEIGAMLLQSGAFLRHRDRRGRTALVSAAQMGRADALRWLLSADSGLMDIADSEGNTPLHLAVARRRAVGFEMFDPWWTPGTPPACAAALLAGGANPDARNRDGETPLHLAAAWRFLPAVALLIANGARPGIVNNRGLRPIDAMDFTPIDSLQPPPDFDQEGTEREIRALLAP